MRFLTSIIKRLFRLCSHDGCWKAGEPCYLPDAADPSEYACHAHHHAEGYCYGCGQFFGGIESFEFGNGLCDDCNQDLCFPEDDEDFD